MKIDYYIILICLKSEPMGKLINSIPGSHLLISSFPVIAWRTCVEFLGKTHDSTTYKPS